jgi:hypothetical protein
MAEVAEGVVEEAAKDAVLSILLGMRALDAWDGWRCAVTRCQSVRASGLACLAQVMQALDLWMDDVLDDIMRTFPGGEQLLRGLGFPEMQLPGWPQLLGRSEGMRDRAQERDGKRG